MRDGGKEGGLGRGRDGAKGRNWEREGGGDR